MKRRLLCLVCLLSILLLNAGQNAFRRLASAQDKKIGSRTPEIAEVEGVLEETSGNPLGFKIKAKDGETYAALFARDTSLIYSGKADIKLLQPGLLVRFVAPFYPQSLLPQAPVKEIEVFRPVKKRRMTQQEMLRQSPGIHPWQEKERGKEKGKDKLEPPPAGMQYYQVVGQLRGVLDKKLQIVAGNYQVLAELDPSAVISVASGDAFFCQPGDAVKVTGLRDPSQPTMIQAEKVEITGSKVLGAPPEESQKSDKPARRSRLDRNKR